MNRKLKFLLAALLGFSAACSSVRNAPKNGADNPRAEADSLSKSDTLRHRIIVMYGVRRPLPAQDKTHQSSVDPVAERPQADSFPEVKKAPAAEKPVKK